MATLTSTGVNFSDGSVINGTTAGIIGSYLVGVTTPNVYQVFNSNYTTVKTWAPGNALTARAGTWRCMGPIPGGGFSAGCCGYYYASIFVRIA